ncbi:ABC transporter permease [Planctomycetota bacterium]
MSTRSEGHPGAVFGLLPLLIWYGLFLLIPMASLVREVVVSPDGAGSVVSNTLRSPAYVRIMGHTLAIAFEVAFFATLIAVAVAWVYQRSGDRGRLWLEFCLFGPLMLSFLVKTYGFIVLLQRKGAVNSVLIAVGVVDDPMKLLYTRHGVVIIMTYLLFPFATVPAVTGFKMFDSRLKSVAAACGASRVETFLRVTLPQLLPGVLLGSGMVFLSAFGFYIVPALAGGPKETTYSLAIDALLNVSFDWPSAAVLSLVGILVVVVLLVISGLLLSHRRLRFLLAGFGGRQ